MLLPSMIRLTSYYLINAKNNDDINFEFFSRDILYDTEKLKYKLQIENSHTIKLSNNNDVIRYVLIETVKFTKTLIKKVILHY